MKTIAIDTLNALSFAEANAWFTACCASSQWSQHMVAARPFNSLSDIVKAANKQWNFTAEADWLEAFEAHPMIGNVDSLRAKFANTKQLAGNEQSGATSATEQELEELHLFNQTYKKKFGFIFIVCATGLGATTMLCALKERIENTRPQELRIASQEQLKITLLRINKGLTNNEIPDSENTHEL